MKKHILLILDGYGIAENPEVSAIDQAKKPYLDHLFATYPHSTLVASGTHVGLPEGQMGNSEVGHLNLGAGRIVYQDISRIDLAIEDGSFFENECLLGAIQRALAGDGKLHLMGLLSDGGVHSHIRHLEALITMARKQGLRGDRVVVHAFTDGRDTSPTGGIEYVEHLNDHMRNEGTGRLATVVGRYYAMDRDARWKRIKIAYDALVRGTGEAEESAVLAMRKMYNSGTTDEFVQPIVIGSESEIRSSRVHSGDEVVFFNFRADRARQMCTALSEKEFSEFAHDPLEITISTFTEYDKEFAFPVAFPKQDLHETIGEVISREGGRQLRAAETEKYPHVTYFFSGGREEPFPGEDRILVPSPQVATYDLQPEMSAEELSIRVADAIATEAYDFVLLNFANPDMVGHTGVFDAAVNAIEAVDRCTRRVVEAGKEHGYTVQIIADHGNADKMINDDGSAHTAHTTALVPHLIVSDRSIENIQAGKLADVATTALAMMGIDIPDAMDGEVLVS